MKIRNVILSWDTFAAGVGSVIVWCLIPPIIDSNFSLGLYNIAINVLSIIFSLFFASTAIIMTSSDNDFIAFLEEENDFSDILADFSLVLGILFISLIYAIIASLVTAQSIRRHPDDSGQIPYAFLVFVFLFIYSLAATALSIRETIQYSSRRAEFLLKKRGIEKQNQKGK